MTRWVSGNGVSLSHVARCCQEIYDIQYTMSFLFCCNWCTYLLPMTTDGVYSYSWIRPVRLHCMLTTWSSACKEDMRTQCFPPSTQDMFSHPIVMVLNKQNYNSSVLSLHSEHCVPWSCPSSRVFRETTIEITPHRATVTLCSALPTVCLRGDV